MRRGGVWNTAEGKREPQNIWRNIKAGLEGLQPLEIPQNHQSFLWKSLDKNSLDLEKLGKMQSLPPLFRHIRTGVGRELGTVTASARGRLGDAKFSCLQAIEIP